MTENEKKRVFSALKKLPLEPGDVERKVFSYRKLDFKKNFLIYRGSSSKRAVRCYCTSCRTEFNMPYVSADEGVSSCRWGSYYKPKHFGFFNEVLNDKVFSKDDTMCPNCAEYVKALHYSDVGKGYEVLTNALASVHVIDKLIVLVNWQYERYLHSNGTFSYKVQPVNANLFGENFSCYATRSFVTYNSYSGHQLSFRNYWTVPSKADFSVDGIYKELFFSLSATELERSELPNCKLDVFIDSIETGKAVQPARYLSAYLKYPYIENLVMNGASYLVNDFIAGRSSLKGCLNRFDFRKKKPSASLGLDKLEFNMLVKKSQIPFEAIEFYRSNKEEFSLEDFLYYLGDYSVSSLYELAEFSFGILKPLKYLEKQKKKFGFPFDIPFLIDYWKMMKKTGLPFDPFPQNLEMAHDRACALLEPEKFKKKSKNFKKRFEALSKYSFEFEDLFIKPCASDSALYKEGNYLHHCVHNYSDDYSSGRTAIFFIRKKEVPEIPYYTLEFDEKNCLVRQNKGMRNNRYEPVPNEVVVFEKKWLEFVKKVMEDEKNGKSSSKSKSRVSASA